LAFWICEIVGVRPDGSLTWRRSGAAEPRGVLYLGEPVAVVRVGDLVRISAIRDWSGRWEVESWEPMGPCPPPVVISEQVPVGARVGLECGQLRWTSVMNPLENPLSVGKPRPAVLVSDLGQSWRVMGLTTKDRYESGAFRVAIPDYLAVGLVAPGYLWGKRLTRVRTSDVGEYIGLADRRLVEELLALAHDDLSPDEQRTLTALAESFGSA